MIGVAGAVHLATICTVVVAVEMCRIARWLADPVLAGSALHSGRSARCVASAAMIHVLGESYFAAVRRISVAIRETLGAREPFAGVFLARALSHAGRLPTNVGAGAAGCRPRSASVPISLGTGSTRLCVIGETTALGSRGGVIRPPRIHGTTRRRTFARPRFSAIRRRKTITARNTQNGPNSAAEHQPHHERITFPAATARWRSRDAPVRENRARHKRKEADLTQRKDDE